VPRPRVEAGTIRIQCSQCFPNEAVVGYDCEGPGNFSPVCRCCILRHSACSLSWLERDSYTLIAK